MVYCRLFCNPTKEHLGGNFSRTAETLSRRIPIDTGANRFYFVLYSANMNRQDVFAQNRPFLFLWRGQDDGFKRIHAISAE